MSKHTPGPWAVGPDLEVFYALNGVEITRPLKLTSMAGRTEEDRANARLIAAAPELLEALKVIASHWPHWASQMNVKQIDLDAIALVRSAIAKGTPDA
jgi:hypothetical protein